MVGGNVALELLLADQAGLLGYVLDADLLIADLGDDALCGKTAAEVIAE